MQIHDDKLQELARATLAIEAEAVQQLGTRIDERFVRACRYMFACAGRGARHRQIRPHRQ